MIESIKNNLRMIIFSVVVHIVLIALLAISFNSKIELKNVATKPNVIKAVAVDANKIKAQLDKLKREDEKKKNQEKDRLAKLKREEKKLRKKRAVEEKRLANLKKKRKAEEKKRKLEQKNLAKLKKEQKALKKKQATEAKKRKAEKARLAKKKQQASLKKKQELAKKKKEAEAKKRRQELAQQLEAEEREEADEQLLREIDKYTTLIKQKIKRNWIKPQGDLTTLLATFNIRLIPGGDVIEVRITRTSGNLIYDRNAERAVRKASPLPLPKNPAIAAKFYSFYFDFIE